MAPVVSTAILKLELSWISEMFTIEILLSNFDALNDTVEFISKLSDQHPQYVFHTYSGIVLKFHWYIEMFCEFDCFIDGFIL